MAKTLEEALEEVRLNGRSWGECIWKPIETAPEDATSILVYFEKLSTYRVYRSCGVWYLETKNGPEVFDVEKWKPLFWMEVPIPYGY